MQVGCRRLPVRHSFDSIICDSPAIRAAVLEARRAAGTPATVLLCGESGTGKELFAHNIHGASARRDGPFIGVSCAALAESLLESELFGYADGAFTGARRGGRRGLFEEAAGGTLFLDEVGSMSPALQAKLLRVLQEREVVRVGDCRPQAVDVRIIAATNACLEAAMERGTFRPDLYYRLAMVPITLPPLRDRRQDILPLVRHLLARFGREYGRRAERAAPAALQVLQAHAWPGNVRELENVIGRAVPAMDPEDRVLEAAFLPPLKPGPPPGRSLTLPEALFRTERALLEAALQETGGNKAEVARRLGIAPRTLYHKLERHGLCRLS